MLSIAAPRRRARRRNDQLAHRTRRQDLYIGKLRERGDLTLGCIMVGRLGTGWTADAGQVSGSAEMSRTPHALSASYIMLELTVETGIVGRFRLAS